MFYSLEEEEEQTGIDITDRTDAKAMALRRQIYLTIMSRYPRGGTCVVVFA